MLDEEPQHEYPTSKELFIYFIVFIYLVILQASCVLWSKWNRIKISNGQEATDWQFTSAAAFKKIHLVVGARLEQGISKHVIAEGLFLFNFAPLNFLESSAEWLAFRKFSIFRIFWELSREISVPFVFVSKFSALLVKWKTPHITKQLQLFNIVSRLVGECLVAVSIECFFIFWVNLCSNTGEWMCTSGPGRCLWFSNRTSNLVYLWYQRMDELVPFFAEPILSSVNQSRGLSVIFHLVTLFWLIILEINYRQSLVAFLAYKLRLPVQRSNVLWCTLSLNMQDWYIFGLFPLKQKQKATKLNLKWAACLKPSCSF